MVGMVHTDECSQVCSQKYVIKYFSTISELQIRSEAH